MFSALQQRFVGLAASVGGGILAGVQEVRSLLWVAGRTYAFAFRDPKSRKKGEVGRQMFLVGNKSVLFVTATMGFLGMIMVYQSCLQAQRIIGNLDLIGPIFLQLLIRDFGPSICALMVATRVGSGIAAEIGSMVVTDQVDALRMCGADPVNYLIVPRFLATTVMMLVLAIWAVLVSHMAGMMTAHFGFKVAFETYLQIHLVTASDVATGCVKALSYGMAIPIIAGWCGLVTSGGSEGVGWATTKAVVSTSFAVIILNLVISSLAYLVTGALE
jgi:phospholipid/cholesterol/gamma-HCH transport system permease protein